MPDFDTRISADSISVSGPAEGWPTFTVVTALLLISLAVFVVAVRLGPAFLRGVVGAFRLRTAAGRVRDALAFRLALPSILVFELRRLPDAALVPVVAFPASPYWSAEWKALGEGKDSKLYKPLTHVEMWVPAWFAAIYVGATIALIWVQ
ncbi:hypothetical protein ACFL6C_04090 [Myxococcota bacterium]